MTDPAPKSLRAPRPPPERRLPFRTLRVGANVTRAIFNMTAPELHAFEAEASVGPHTPPIHIPEARPIGGR